jgi:hypothetical protein
MTLAEIKSKFSVNEMLEKIKTFTKDLENARIKMMHACKKPNAIFLGRIRL